MPWQTDRDHPLSRLESGLFLAVALIALTWILGWTWLGPATLH